MFIFLVLKLLILVNIVRSEDSSYEQSLNVSAPTSRKLQSATNQRSMKKGQIKAERLKKLVTMIEALPIPANFIPESWSKPHTRSGPAIFAAAMTANLRRADANYFVNTARKTGYKGDIVLAILPTSGEAFTKALRDYDCIAYTVNPT
jgi:hypothetical protein